MNADRDNQPTALYPYQRQMYSVFGFFLSSEQGMALFCQSAGDRKQINTAPLSPIDRH